ncbi:MAG TPA: LPXTG cell wall anchor domain-containing protein, partial [Planctomycetota bacterium]|nr:LPXTG cell wall anchor domain-containing protein [Planctomycetota bacterium]
EGDAVRAVSERSWVLHFESKAGDGRRPSEFVFPAAVWEGAKAVYQRYEDADLVEVGRIVPLGGSIGRRGRSWVWAVAGLVLLAAAGAVVVRRRRRQAVPALAGADYRVPEPATPFNVLGLLRRLRGDARLVNGSSAELDRAIARIERHFFDRDPGEAPDLRGIATEWVEKVRRTPS